MLIAEAGGSASGVAIDASRFYGLLYIDRKQDRHVNLRNSADPIAVYAGCASLLAASARAAGESFTVLTNALAELRSVVEAAGFPPFDCREMAFDLDLPPNTRFFQAHHKLCVLEALGSGDFGSFVGLVDIDAVMQAPLSKRLGRAPGIHVYAIDEGLADARIGDLDFLIGPSEGQRRWYGGEFIAGDSVSMQRLATTCMALLPRYLDVLPRLLHVGDEMILSAAVNLMEQEGAPIRDVGSERIVARWYSSRLRVAEEPLTQALDATIVHLPTDKTFLCDQARQPFTVKRFRHALVRHAFGKSLVRSLVNPVLNLAKGENKYAPSVWHTRRLTSRERP